MSLRTRPALSFSTGLGPPRPQVGMCTPFIKTSQPASITEHRSEAPDCPGPERLTGQRGGDKDMDVCHERRTYVP